MFDLEKLTGVTLPDDLPSPPPVLKATQDALVTKLRAVSTFLRLMADQVERHPWGDYLFDLSNEQAAQMLLEAGEALVTFRATRDCAGRS